jgi:hypothetical protein
MIPTVTSVSPARIFTGGQFVTITGTGFQTAYPIDPATHHPWSTPAPSVVVSVGGRVATKIRVLSSTQITCVLPSADPGAVSLTVRNLAANGSFIAGETVTVTNKLTAARVDLALPSDELRLVEALVAELKRQVIENVSFFASVDYESEPEALEFAGVDRAKLPALALSGPIPQRNRFYGDLRPTAQNSDGTFFRRSTFETEDISFQLRGFTNHTGQYLNLHALVTEFFKTNNYLTLQRDPSDSSKGFVRYELEATEFVSASINSTNDLRVFYGTVTVKGFQFEDVAGYPTQLVQEATDEVDDISILVEGVVR